MADAPAKLSPPPASVADGDGDPSSPSVAVPRVLPSTMFQHTLPPPSGRARGPRGGRAAAALGSGGRGGGRAAAASGSGGRGGGRPAAASGSGGRGGGRRNSALPAATSYGTGGRRVDPLVDSVLMVGEDVDAEVVSADILDLAMANRPLFEWLSYWPEEGFRKEDHPY